MSRKKSSSREAGSKHQPRLNQNTTKTKKVRMMKPQLSELGQREPPKRTSAREIRNMEEKLRLLCERTHIVA